MITNSLPSGILSSDIFLKLTGSTPCLQIRFGVNVSPSSTLYLHPCCIMNSSRRSSPLHQLMRLSHLAIVSAIFMVSVQSQDTMVLEAIWRDYNPGTGFPVPWTSGSPAGECPATIHCVDLTRMEMTKIQLPQLT